MTTNNTPLTSAQKWDLIQEVANTWGLSDELQVLANGLMVKALAKGKGTKPIQDAVIEVRNAVGAKQYASETIDRARLDLENGDYAYRLANQDVDDTEMHLRHLGDSELIDDEEVVEAELPTCYENRY